MMKMITMKMKKVRTRLRMMVTIKKLTTTMMKKMTTTMKMTKMKIMKMTMMKMETMTTMVMMMMILIRKTLTMVKDDGRQFKQFEQFRLMMIIIKLLILK